MYVVTTEVSYDRQPNFSTHGAPQARELELQKEVWSLSARKAYRTVNNHWLWSSVRLCILRALHLLAWDQAPHWGKKEKNRRGRKKKIGERREPRGSLGREKDGPDSLWLASLTYIFLFDPIFCRAWSQASHHYKNETKGNEDESKEVQFPAAEMPLIK